MKVKVALVGLFLLIFCFCTKQGLDNPKSILSETYQLGDFGYCYSGYNLIDTGYWCYFSATGYQSYKGFRLSNSVYDCSDTIPELAVLKGNDSTLTITFSTTKLNQIALINKSLFTKELYLATISSLSKGLNTNTNKATLSQYYGIPFIAVTNQITELDQVICSHGMVKFAVDSNLIQIRYNSFGHNQSEKTETIFKILRSIKNSAPSSDKNQPLFNFKFTNLHTVSTLFKQTI